MAGNAISFDGLCVRAATADADLCGRRRLRVLPFHPSGGPSRPWQLIRLAKFPNVIDRKRILSRHSRAELAPLRRTNAGAFHRLVGALNDFADWFAIRDPYKNVRISRSPSHLGVTSPRIRSANRPLPVGANLRKVQCRSARPLTALAIS
jgi:hypothetical protein